MSLAEIRDWFGRARTDYWYKTQMPISQGALAVVAEINQKTLWDIFSTDVMPKHETLEKLEATIKRIENREVVWYRKPGQEYVYAHLDVRKIRPRRAKLSTNNGFDVFSICASCQSNKWVPVKIDGKEHIVCYSCLPPNQWLALGATGVKRSLVKDYIEGNKHA
jgi:hypothetical protein